MLNVLLDSLHWEEPGQRTVVKAQNSNALVSQVVMHIMPPQQRLLFVSYPVLLCCLQLEEFDQRTGVLSKAQEASAVIAQRAIGAMSKAAEDKRVQGVVTNVSTGW